MEDDLSEKMDESDNRIIEGHKEIEGQLEEHESHVNSELVELQYNHSKIDSKIDSLDSKQDQLSTEVMSVEDNVLRNVTKELRKVSGGLHYSLGHVCGGEGGWRRVVYLDIRDPNTNCPSGWQLTALSKRSCGRVSPGGLTCDSVFFPVTGGPYTRVCGRVRGYQYRSTDAFEAYHHGYATTIDDAYVAGVSLTHGPPGSRQHIWTFAAGIAETFFTHLMPVLAMLPFTFAFHHLLVEIISVNQEGIQE